MTRAILRHLAPLLVVLSLIAPMGGAAMASFLGDARTIVICTSDGLRTLTLDAEGNPVETSDSAEICALVHATDTAQGAVPATVSQANVTALTGLAVPNPAPPAVIALAALPRAPPRA